MKTTVRYCQVCEHETRWDVEKELRGFVRWFFAVGTLGFSEVINDTIFTCQRCGEQRIVEPI